MREDGLIEGVVQAVSPEVKARAQRETGASWMMQNLRRIAVIPRGRLLPSPVLRILFLCQ